MKRQEVSRAARTVVQHSLPQPASEAGGPYLVVRTAQRVWEVPLDRDVLTIGRAPNSDIFLSDPGISRYHARVERRGDGHAILDLKSTNGTWLGLQRIEEHVLLDGDTVFVGTSRLIYKRGAAATRSPVPEPPQPAQAARVEIAIDEARCRSQVEEVIGSDTYQQILARARKLRQARQTD